MMIGGVSSASITRGEVVDGLRDGELGDDVGVLAQRLDLDLEAGVGRGEDRQPLAS